MTIDEHLRNYKIDANGCWVWQGGTVLWNGYGNVALPRDGGPRRFKRIHRLSWEAHHGQEVPIGLVIDHLCRNRLCINPDHLEAVTNRENIRRGKNGFALTGRCLSGKHEIRSAADIKPNGTKADGTQARTCRACAQERQANHV